VRRKKRTGKKDNKNTNDKNEKDNEKSSDESSTQGEFKPDRWHENYKKLVAYKEKNGHPNVPHEYNEDKKLGLWVHNQRVARKKGTLTAEKLNLLEKLYFVWYFHEKDPPQKQSPKSTTVTVKSTSRYRDDAWTENYKALVEYKKKHGDANVPQNYGPLGHWVHDQRKTYKSGKMREDRRQKLEEIKISWATRGERTTWQDYYNQLVEYCARHGSLEDLGEKKGFSKLANWLETQKKKKEDGKLTKEQKKSLQEIDAL